MFRTVFFDYGGTLDAPGIAWRDRFYPIYLDAGIRVPQEIFARAFYASDDSLVEENPVRMNLSEIVSEQVKRVLENLKSFDRSVHRTITSRFLEDTFSYLEEIRPVLRMLKDHFSMGIISNNYGNLENICRETGLDTFMDVLVDSNIAGVIKPDPRIFETGLSALGTAPASAVMVGDSLERDIKGAGTLGMTGVWLTAKGRPELLTKEPENILVISRLHELPRLLGVGEAE